MLRRLLPYLLVVFWVLIDISVVPVFTASIFVMPLALVFTMCTGALLGRMHGLLCGLVGGLLVDILAGTPLGYMMLTYLGCGYVAGMGGYDSDEARAQESYSYIKAFFRRTLAVFVALGLFELVTMVYQYFNTALFQWIYAGNAFVRMLIGAAAFDVMYYLTMPLLVGRATARVLIGARREVKNL
jgi:cell shape-determining protein MreD